MSSVLVVVIVGVIVVAITVVATRDGRKPATPGEAPRRDPAPAAAPGPAITPDPPAPWSPPPRPVLDPAPIGPAHLAARPAEVVVDDPPGLLGRVRSGVLLGATILALGSLVAALVGGGLLVGYFALRSALG